MKTPLEMICIKATTTGQIIKAFRKYFVIAQEDMAWACCISQANLSAIENDRRDIGTKVAVKLSAFLGIAPSVLLFPSGYDSLPEYKDVIKKMKKLGQN